MAYALPLDAQIMHVDIIYVCIHTYTSTYIMPQESCELPVLHESPIFHNFLHGTLALLHMPDDLHRRRISQISGRELQSFSVPDDLAA